MIYGFADMCLCLRLFVVHVRIQALEVLYFVVVCVSVSVCVRCGFMYACWYIRVEMQPRGLDAYFCVKLSTCTKPTCAHLSRSSCG